MPSLTYAELAKALKITPASANKLARRRFWPRTKGNDGRTRVAVPDEALVRPDGLADRPPVSPQDSPPDNPAHALIARLEGELAGMREALADARGRAGTAEAHIESLRAQLSAAEIRAGTEAAKTTEAIAAFQSLAQRLEAIAEARRPWWRRLVG
jgi:hypothetical protein